MTGDYTNDWCDTHDTDWREVLAHLIGKSNVRMIEIGSYEGRSACWFAENILTGEGANLLCVDPWEDYPERTGDDMAAVEARFDRNTAGLRQVFKYKGTVAELFRPDHVKLADAVYIDGSHSAPDVLTDAVFTWQLLKVGGLMMWDDYLWEPEDGGPNKPELAIDAFLAVMVTGGRCELVRKEKRLVVARRLA